MDDTIYVLQKKFMFSQDLIRSKLNNQLEIVLVFTERECEYNRL